MIVSEVGKYTAKLSAIPMNFEKLISFSFSHLKFLDSMGFLTASLDTLVKNLHEGGEIHIQCDMWQRKIRMRRCTGDSEASE